MAKLAGQWKLESSEHFDEYMKAVGVGFATRKLGNLAKPSVTIKVDGDTWTIETHSTFKNTLITFELGKEFDETTADGRKLKSVCTVEGDTKLIQTQKGEVDSTLTRELTDDNTMILTCVAKDVTCKRTYKREQ